MAGRSDILEVARFATLPEAELAAGFLRRSGIDARLPDRDTATMNPDLLFALGGVRVVAPDDQVAAARDLIARMRAGEFVDDAADDGEWALTPGDEDDAPGETQRTGVMGLAKRAGTVVIVTFFVLLPLVSCLYRAVS